MKAPVTLLIATASAALLAVNAYRTRQQAVTEPTAGTPAASARSHTFKPTMVATPKIVGIAAGQTEVVRPNGFQTAARDGTRTVSTQAPGQPTTPAPASSTTAPAHHGLQSPKL